MDINTKQQCFCLSCDSTFNIRDAAKTKRKIYELDIEEKKCPYCYGDFKMLNLPYFLDKYLDVNTDPKYYIYK